MKGKIEVINTRRKGDSTLHPGIYRVPEDISRADADAAIKDGDAVALDAKPAPVMTKKEAPQNKSFRAAPENKAAGDSGGDGAVADKPGRKTNRKRGKK